MGSGSSCCACVEETQVKEEYEVFTFDQKESEDYAVFKVNPQLQHQAHKQECWFSFIYAKYIPFMVRERFQIDNRKLQHAELEKFAAAVAFVDISGFTKLSERLIKEYGPEGAEKLNAFISGYFDKLIKVIVDHGGDIIKFAGDAMLVVWRNPRAPVIPVEDKPASRASVSVSLGNSKRGSMSQVHAHAAAAAQRNRARKNMKAMLGDGDLPLKMLVLRAAVCNLTLLAHHNNFRPPGLPPESDIKLQLHTGIGCGQLSGLYVGGVNDMWEFFVAGDPIEQMSDAGEEAKSGDVMLSKQAHALIADTCRGKMQASGNFKITGLKDRIHMFKFHAPQITQKQKEALTGFVPMAVKKHIDAGLSALWLAEYRQVFIMFVVLPGVDYADPDVCNKLHAAVGAVQEAVFHFDGTIARLLADDKGTRFKIAFGMPSMHHEDDGVRVVKSALLVRDKLNELQQPAAIGVASGLVFCGEAGSQQRCEYTAVGNKVIIAARLMQAAGKMGNITLCDEETYRTAKAHVMFNARPPIPLKGVKKRVPIYQPVALLRKHKSSGGSNKAARLLGTSGSGRRSRSVARRSTSLLSLTESKNSSTRRSPRAVGRRRSLSFFRRSNQVITGRSAEKQFLKDALLKVIRNDSPETMVVLVEGEGGMGKSALVSDFISYAELLQLEFLYGTGDGQENKTPHFPFRSVFEQLCGLQGTSGADKTGRNLAVQQLLDGGSMSMAALLNPILGTSFAETPYLKKMNADVRADKTQLLLLDIVQRKVEERSPRIIILEDMQFFDSASWALTYDLCVHIPRLFLIITMRKPHRPYPTNYKKILHLPTTQELVLGMLSKEEVTELAARRIGVPEVPDSLADALYEKAQGHPLYVEELTQALLDQKLISVRGGRLVMDPRIEKEGLASVDSQGSVHSVIVGRIDQMPGNLRITLQTCSVIGQEIQFDVLRSVHPSNSSVAKLQQEMIALEEAGYLSEQTDENGLSTSVPTYVFKHSFFMEAAYNMLTVAKRKELHLQVAQLLVSQDAAEDDVAVLGVLARHYTKGHDWPRALQWTRRAGDNAISVNANSEAVRYFQQALDIMNDHRTHLDKRALSTSAVVEVEANLAGALYAMGRYTECIEHYRAALALMGIDIPSSRRKGVTGLLKAGLKDFFKKTPDQAGAKSTESNSGVADEFDDLEDDPMGSLHSVPAGQQAHRKHTRYSSGQEQKDDEHRRRRGSRGPHSRHGSTISGASRGSHSRGHSGVYSLGDFGPLDSVDGLDAKEREELEDRAAIPLLEKMVLACTMSSRKWEAGYCAFHSVTLGDRLGDKAVLTLGYSMCAHSCMLLQWMSLADKYEKKTQWSYDQLVRHLVDPAYTARIKFQQALLLRARGKWREAFEVVRDAMEFFLENGDSKRWRECNFQRAVCLFYLNNYNAALAAFHDVLISAQKDGDMYYEAQAVYWKAFVALLTHGGSDAIYRSVRQGLSLVADLPGYSKVPLAVLLTLNGYLQLTSQPEPEQKALVEYRRLVELNLGDDNLAQMLKGELGAHDELAFHMVTTLLLDAAAVRVSVLEKEEHPDNLEDHSDAALMPAPGIDRVRSSSLSPRGSTRAVDCKDTEKSDDDDDNDDDSDDVENVALRALGAYEMYDANGLGGSSAAHSSVALASLRELAARHNPLGSAQDADDTKLDHRGHMHMATPSIDVTDTRDRGASAPPPHHRHSGSRDSRRLTVGTDSHNGSTFSFLSLHAWGKGKGVASSPLCTRILERAHKLILRFTQRAKLFPFTRAMVLLLQGRYEKLLGNDKKARQVLLTGLAEAERFGLNYWEGLILYELACMALPESAERVRNLNRVVHIFNLRDIRYIPHPSFLEIVRMHNVVRSSGKMPQRLERRQSFSRHKKATSVQIANSSTGTWTSSSLGSSRSVDSLNSAGSVPHRVEHTQSAYSAASVSNRPVQPVRSLSHRSNGSSGSGGGAADVGVGGALRWGPHRAMSLRRGQPRWGRRDSFTLAHMDKPRLARRNSFSRHSSETIMGDIEEAKEEDEEEEEESKDNGNDKK